MALQVRERPPLRLSVNVTPDAASPARWGMDEPDPQNAPSGLTFSSTMPGGFEQLQATLARKPSVDYTDLEEFETVTVSGAGGRVAWQGRLETTPRTSGNQISISPGAVGWQAALSDDGSAQMIYVDRDLSKWGAPSTQRQINVAPSFNASSGQATPDPSSGAPAIAQVVTDDWTTTAPIVESWYDAGPGNLIGTVWYDRIYGGNTGPGGSWLDEVYVSSDAVASTVISTGNIYDGVTLNEVAGALNPATAYRYAALKHLWNGGASGTPGQSYAIYWRNLAVYGNHGLPGHGATGNVSGGFLASDIVTHAVSTWAPQLALADTGGAGTIPPTTFVILQASYPTPTTAADIIAGVTKYELLDWAVWEGPTFWMNARNGRGRSWRARVGPSGLSETGPQVDRIYNQVAVTYTDVTGATLMVGPITDPDPSNPATLAGLTRCFNIPNIGVSVAGAATQIGQAFLAQQKAVSTAGQAQITGYIQDSNGVTYPSWMIRAGDNITFVDAHDPVPRRIVKTSYSDDTKVNQLDLDSPPQGLQALLARLGAADAVLGF